MSNLQNYYGIIVIALLICWVGYLNWKVSSLEAKLNLSEFNVEKAKNAQKVDSLSKPELDDELTASIKRFGSGPTATL